LKVALKSKADGGSSEKEELKSTREQLRISMEENSTLRKAFSQAGTELKKLEDENGRLREQAPPKAWGSTAASSFAGRTTGNSYLRDSSDSFRASPNLPVSTPFHDSSCRFGDSLRPPPSGMVPGTACSGYGSQEVVLNSELRRLEDENMRLRTALVTTAGSGLRPPNAGAQQLSAEEAALREENAKLRKSMRTLNEEKNKLKAEMTHLKEIEKAPQESDPCLSNPGSHRISGQHKIGSSEVSTCPGTGVTTSSGLVSDDSVYAAGLSPAHQSSPVLKQGQRLEFNGLDLQQHSFSEFEPIIEHATSHSQAQPPLPAGPVPGSAGALPPKPAFGRTGDVAHMAPKLTMDYYRQMGIRTTWRPGDIAYRRGEPCQIIQVVWDEQPPHVIVRTPEGTEVSTEFCLLSEGPASNKYGSSHAPPSPGKPPKLAPLGDLLLDRPPMPPSPGQLPTVVPRSSSLPARAVTEKLQPIGLLPRTSGKIAGSGSRCASPVAVEHMSSYARSLSRSPN